MSTASEDPPICAHNEVSVDWAHGIISLQTANCLNVPGGVTEDIAQKCGYCTLRHTPEQLHAMGDIAPQVIFVDKEAIGGYCLTMIPNLSDHIVPILESAFTLLRSDALRFQQKPIGAFRWYFAGQVCVDAKFRGRGMATKLYHAQGNMMRDRGFEVAVTCIAADNVISIQAHFKAGFEEIEGGRHGWDGNEAKWVMVARAL